MSRMGRRRIGRLSDAFARDGFVNAGTVLDADELAALRHELERFADVQIRGLPANGPMPMFEETKWPGKLYKMTFLSGCSPLFRRLTENSHITSMAAELLQARTLQVWADIIHYKAPRGGGAFVWHQDGHYHTASPADRIIAAWIALDDADEESGCMWMVPGSHEWGDRDPYLRQVSDNLQQRAEVLNLRRPEDVGESIWREPVSCPVKAGEVHFHHAYAWHASPVNTSDRLRRGYTIFYMADGIETATKQGPIVFERPAPSAASTMGGKLGRTTKALWNGGAQFARKCASKLGRTR